MGRWKHRFDKEGIDMMEIERPKIETASLSPDGRYGKFVAEPLERGFGITLGNSLRRVLLSSLPGVAVTSVKIDGVVHEFSTIEGVKEDVTEIVLNLKGIAAKLYTDGPKTVRVEAVGPCEVTADNIKQGDDIEILNPEWHIATLGEGAKLVMELTFDKGRGYVPAERNKQAIIEKKSECCSKNCKPKANATKGCSCRDTPTFRWPCLPVSDYGSGPTRKVWWTTCFSFRPPTR